MPRIPRGTAEGFIYHVFNRGNDKKTIFHKDSDYAAFIKLVRDAKNRHPVQMMAYCIMPNHFHFVVMPTNVQNLSKLMQWLMTSHVRRYHKFHNSSGHIWQGRYRSFIIQNDIHLLTVVRYVEGNPVRARLVSAAREWPWSSYRERVGIQEGRILDPIPLILPRDWESFVNMPLTDEEKSRLTASVARNTPFGDSQWVMNKCGENKLEHTLRPRGRKKGDRLLFYQKK